MTGVTFDELDDVLLAHSAGRGRVAASWLATAQFSEIGPTLEYCVQTSARDSSLPALNALPTTRVTKEVLSLPTFSRRSVSFEPKNVEIQRIPHEPSQIVEPEWTAFQQRLKLASEASGFSSMEAAGITGAFWEMVDNAVLHSDTPNTMLAGYQWDCGAVAYCVADSGIGVLRSLRKCSEFFALQDHGEALRMAVRDGASRFGSKSGHGRGFKQVFKSLAGMSGNLRFRSGDFSLELDGSNLTCIETSLSQRAFLQGFVVTVICRAQ